MEKIHKQQLEIR